MNTLLLVLDNVIVTIECTAFWKAPEPCPPHDFKVFVASMPAQVYGMCHEAMKVHIPPHRGDSDWVSRVCG
jgi:hypothetical protein